MVVSFLSKLQQDALFVRVGDEDSRTKMSRTLNRFPWNCPFCCPSRCRLASLLEPAPYLASSSDMVEYAQFVIFILIYDNRAKKHPETMIPPLYPRIGILWNQFTSAI